MRLFDGAVSKPKMYTYTRKLALFRILRRINSLFNIVSSLLPCCCFEEEGYSPEIFASSTEKQNNLAR